MVAETAPEMQALRLAAGRVPSGVLGVLYDLSSLVLSGVEPQRKLRAILETITDLLPVERCCLVLLEQGTDGGRLPAANDLDPLGELDGALEKYPAIRRALSTGRVVLVDSPPGEARGTAVPGRPGTFGLSSILTAPVHFDGEIIGILFIRLSPGRCGFRPWEADFCAVLANIAAPSLIQLRRPDGRSS